MMKVSGWVGGAVTLIAAGFFLFSHFASSQETETRSKSTETMVKELQEINMKQFTAEQAEINQMTQLCITGVVTSVEKCAEVGVDVRK